MRLWKNAVAALAGLTLVAYSQIAQSADDDQKDVQVMVIGTYHMAPSNQDVVNMEVESVLSDRRQSELAAVAQALAAFNPTVVATERETEAPGFVDPNFSDYSAGMLAENANERVQIAYRLADAASVTRVFGIDERGTDEEPDYFPFPRLMKHVEERGQTDILQSMIAEAQEMTQAFAGSQADRSIAQLLIDVNTGPLSSADIYYRFAEFDHGDAQPGAELNAYWFMRNAKIFSKLMQVTKPGDRVVVVYGAGHKHWLEHLVDNTPGYKRVDPVPFLETALAAQ
jgi:hypothetical protein